MDKITGKRVWHVRVVDMDPTLEGRSREIVVKIAADRAVATSRLGLTKIAIEAFGQAEEATRSPKQAAIVATEQARALAASGHLDQACATALAAYEVGCSYDSERVRQAVRDFRSGPGARAPHRLTADLDERLHSAYATRAT